MQAVWSRSVRPQSTCRCISCVNPLPSTLSRRTTTGIARKRLTAGNAFSLLLGPVLGGALVADTKAKDKRRREWDEKIAAAQAEVEQIRRNGVKPYSISSRNLRRLPALSRSYSSAAVASLVIADDDHSIGADVSLSLPQLNHDDQLLASGNSHESGSHQEAGGQNTQVLLNEEIIDKCKRLQRLVAIKLAIRMILHIHIGKSPRHIKTSSDYVYDEGSLPQDVNELTRHLKQVSNSLREINLDTLRPYWGPYQNLTRGKTCSLDQDMTELARQFRQGDLRVTQLIERFAGRLISSSESPTIHGYIPFLNVLSRARFDELSFMIDGTIKEARLPCDRHVIYMLLWQYGKNKEAHYFDKLIQKLTTDSATAQFGERWLWRNIDGILVPMPPSKDPQILQILIYTALKCNQPHRAEAWSKILAGCQTGSMWISHVIRNFLRYYSAHQNWHKGEEWMTMALSKAEMLATQGIRHLQRITFAMLDFCVAHGKRSLYRDVLQAAGACRLGVYCADPDLTLTQRSTDILEEWEACHERSQNNAIDVLSAEEKARMFAYKLRHLGGSSQESSADSFRIPHFVERKERNRRTNMNGRSEGLQELEPNRILTNWKKPLISNAHHDEATTDSWRTLCRQQQIQLDLLKRQLEDLKSVQGAAQGPLIKEHDHHPPDAIENIPQGSERTTCAPSPFQSLRKQVGEAEGRDTTKQGPVPRQPLSPRSSSITLLNQRSSSPSSRMTPQTKDEGESPSRLSPPQSEISYLPDTGQTVQRNSYFVREKSNGQTSPSYPLNLTLLRPPNPSEVEHALNFCAHIMNGLAAHIKQFSTIQPLHYLVSNIPQGLLVQLSIDGFFVHFIQQMLTRHEKEISFWDRLTLEVRNHNVSGYISSREEVKIAPLVEANPEVNLDPDPEPQEDDRTDPPLSITFEPTPRKPRPRARPSSTRVRMQPSRDRPAHVKVE